MINSLIRVAYFEGIDNVCKVVKSQNSLSQICIQYILYFFYVYLQLVNQPEVRL